MQVTEQEVQPYQKQQKRQKNQETLLPREGEEAPKPSSKRSRYGVSIRDRDFLSDFDSDDAENSSGNDEDSELTGDEEDDLLADEEPEEKRKRRAERLKRKKKNRAKRRKIDKQKETVERLREDLNLKKAKLQSVKEMMSNTFEFDDEQYHSVAPVFEQQVESAQKKYEDAARDLDHMQKLQVQVAASGTSASSDGDQIDSPAKETPRNSCELSNFDWNSVGVASSYEIDYTQAKANAKTEEE